MLRAHAGAPSEHHTRARHRGGGGATGVLSARGVVLTSPRDAYGVDHGEPVGDGDHGEVDGLHRRPHRPISLKRTKEVARHALRADLVGLALHPSHAVEERGKEEE